MIKTTAMLYDELKDYKDPASKIRRMCRDGELFPLCKGRYETDAHKPGRQLSTIIYGPSYLSFQYALAWYDLIPEAVYEYTSATCLKRKSKVFCNHYGRFSYKDVPIAAFPYGFQILEEDGYPVYLAVPEKALCDLLYKGPVVKNARDLQYLLFDDLRIDEEGLFAMSVDDVKMLAGLYRSNTIYQLAKYLEKHA